MFLTKFLIDFMSLCDLFDQPEIKQKLFYTTVYLTPSQEIWLIYNINLGQYCNKAPQIKTLTEVSKT